MHDLNGGILPNGLFWTVALPGEAVTIDRSSGRVRLDIENVPLIDSFVFLGPNAIPATARLEVSWKYHSPPADAGSGDGVGPADPAAFVGQAFRARAVGHISGQQLGFQFEPQGQATSELGYAQVTFERNGSFL